MVRERKKRILIVAAHPDDEILGCAGTVARLVKEGFEAYTLILGEGKTSRDEKRDVKKRNHEMSDLKAEVSEANKIIGVKEVFLHDFPDNRFDAVNLLDVVKVVEKFKNEINPQIIFTHYENDLNIDHGVTFRAVLTAARPLKDEGVKEIYSFEVLSSSEWRFPLTFSPQVFFDVSKTLALKVKAMAAYKSELREFPHPRSLQGIELAAQNWGMKIGVPYAEAFILVRMIR